MPAFNCFVSNVLQFSINRKGMYLKDDCCFFVKGVAAKILFYESLFISPCRYADDLRHEVRTLTGGRYL